MAKAKTQADQRRDIVATDQHGRPWLMAIELATGGTTGQIDAAGWSDPLRTPQKYLHVPKNTYGTQQWGTIAVDWTAWMRDIAEYAEAWQLRLWEVGREMNKVNFNPKEAETDPYLLKLTGPRPWPSVEALKMAEAGHRELLGLDPLTTVGRKVLGIQTVADLEAEFGTEILSQQKVAELRAEFAAAAPGTNRVATANGDTPTATPAPSKHVGGYQRFVKEAIGSGQARNVKEAAALWRERKAS